MSKSKAQIDGRETSVAIIYGKNSMTLFESDLKRLIDEHTTKEHFVEMAENMAQDYLQMEGYDWDYDSRELQRRLAIIYDNLILKLHIKSSLTS